MVVPTYLGECGTCENCMSGKTNLCQTYPLQAFTGLLTDGTSRMSINDGGGGGGETRLYHFLSCSTWSEYTVVDAHYIVKIDPRIPLPHASFISCGFATGFGAAWKEAKVQKGNTVAVLGLGAVGLGVRIHTHTDTHSLPCSTMHCFCFLLQFFELDMCFSFQLSLSLSCNEGDGRGSDARSNKNNWSGHK